MEPLDRIRLKEQGKELFQHLLKDMKNNYLRRRMIETTPVANKTKVRDALNAIENILKCNAGNKSFEKADVELVKWAHSLPTTHLIVKNTDRFAEKEQLLILEKRDAAATGLLEATPEDGLDYLEPFAPAIKFIAQRLIDYLNCFRKNPGLIKYRPIRICRCGKLFLKNKRQQYCSDNCRKRKYAESKSSEYYADNKWKNENDSLISGFIERIESLHKSRFPVLQCRNRLMRDKRYKRYVRKITDPEILEIAIGKYSKDSVVGMLRERCKRHPKV